MNLTLEVGNRHRHEALIESAARIRNVRSAIAVQRTASDGRPGDERPVRPDPHLAG